MTQHHLIFDPDAPFTAVKIFASTMVADRIQLGERITAWVASANVRIVEVVATQSSDSRFHCFTLTVFYRPR